MPIVGTLISYGERDIYFETMTAFEQRSDGELFFALSVRHDGPTACFMRDRAWRLRSYVEFIPL
jgi:hypothetical protein